MAMLCWVIRMRLPAVLLLGRAPAVVEWMWDALFLGMNGWKGKHGMERNWD